jgi:hypothetical protein
MALLDLPVRQAQVGQTARQELPVRMVLLEQVVAPGLQAQADLVVLLVQAEHLVLLAQVELQAQVVLQVLQARQVQVEHPVHQEPQE